jgi:WD40 repeat protein
VLDEKRIISGGGVDIKIWDIESWLCLQTLTEHWRGKKSNCGVNALKQLGQSQLITGGGDNMITIWDLNQSQCLQTLQGHTQSVFCVKLLFKGAGSRDATIRVWNIERGQCVKKLEGHTDAA